MEQLSLLEGAVLYSASYCSNCGPMKLYLKQMGVEYSVVEIDGEVEIDLPEDLEAIPALYVDGQQAGVGESIKTYVEGL
jgi:glutaredoxin